MQYKDPKLLEALWSYIAKFHVQEHLFPPPPLLQIHHHLMILSWDCLPIDIKTL